MHAYMRLCIYTCLEFYISTSNSNIYIGGDSLRTISVLIAAAVSTFTGASIDVCDAWGAIAVSLLIVVVMLPLAVDLYQACRVLAEEARHEYAELGHGDSELDEILI